MGWFTEDRTEMVPSGREIYEERVTGRRWTELSKLLAIIVIGWLIGSASTQDAAPQPSPSPGAVQTAPAVPAPADRGR